jgi:hypothetical protein
MITTNYKIICADAVTLAIGINTEFKKIREFNFNLSNISANNNTVLTFMIEPVDPDKLVFNITVINDKKIKTIVKGYSISSNVSRVFQEVIPANVFTEKNNNLIIEVKSGDGQLRISDIVLLYRQE